MDFPGGPVAETLHFHCSGEQVPSLVGELRSHMLQCDQLQRKTKIKRVGLLAQRESA